MKTKNRYIYYGILFYFLYTQIYTIISSLLISPILNMKWSIHLIPIIFSILIIVLSLGFYRIKQFPILKIWYILLVVLLSISVSFFNLPEIFYLSGSNSVYSLEQQSIITNYIFTCKLINTVVFLIITYFKYSRSEYE